MNLPIEATLIQFIRENCLPRKSGTTVGLEDNLFDTATLDSAGLIHFVNFIEERFDFVIPDEDLVPAKFATIASIAEYIRIRKREPAALAEENG